MDRRRRRQRIGRAWLHHLCRENGGSYFPWLVNTTANEALFVGVPGTTYSFFSVAIDNAGNVESFPVVPDATTRLATPDPSLRVESATTAIRNQQVEFSVFVENAPRLPPADLSSRSIGTMMARPTN